MGLRYHLLSDDELILLIKRNDESAFVTLYDRYWKRLFVVGSNLLNDHQDVEECLQNVFVGIWNRRHDMVITKGIEQYLAVAIKYQALTRLRRERRRKGTFPELNGVPFNAEVERNDPEMQLLTKELEEKIASSINKLPNTCRLVFKLQKDEGLSILDISKKMQISKNTVKMHLRIATNRLKNDLLLSFPLLITYLFEKS